MSAVQRNLPSPPAREGPGGGVQSPERPPPVPSLRRGRGFVAALLLFLVVLPAQAVEIKRVVSPGGIEAWLVQDATVPVVSIEVAFRGGAATDPDGKSGLANLAASTMDEGAGDLDSQAFQRRVESIASSIRFSASTDNFTATVRTLSKHVGEAFGLLRLCLTQPRFDAQPFERVRSSIVVSLARKGESPNAIASRLWWKNAFEGHPYASHPEGTPETVKALGIEDTRRFVKERIARDVMTVGVVGDISAEALGKLLDEALLPLPEKATPVAIPETNVKNNGAMLLVKKAIPQSVVTFGHAGFKREDPDWYTALVVNYILGGGGFTSRLTEQVREKRGLAYGVYSYLWPLDRAGLAMGGVATENSRVAESIELIREEWRRMAEEGPTAEELANAKTYLTGSFPLQFDSTGRIASTLVDVQQKKLGIEYLDKRNSYIEAVTLDDAKRVARRLLDPAALSFVVVGSPPALPGAREVDESAAKRDDKAAPPPRGRSG